MAKAIDYPADTRNKSRIWFIQLCLARRRRKTECHQAYIINRQAFDEDDKDHSPEQ